MRKVAAEFGLKPDAIRRHRIAHVTPALVSLAGGRAGAISALDRLEELYGKARDVLDAAEEGGRLTLPLAAIKELRSLIELLARITGELDERPVQQTVNILTSPEWLRVQAAMLDALKPHPAARIAVAERLMTLDAHESDSPGSGAAQQILPVAPLRVYLPRARMRDLRRELRHLARACSRSRGDGARGRIGA